MRVVIHPMRLLRWPIPIHIHIELPAFLRRLVERPVRPIVATSVRILQLVNREQGEPDSLVTVLEFNDDVADPVDPEHLDLNQLRSSLIDDGIFFIWTCSCGAPGCAGRFEGVKVAHLDGVTTWHDLDTKRKYVISSTDLQQAYDHAIIEGRAMLSSSIGLDVTPEQNALAYQNDG